MNVQIGMKKIVIVIGILAVVGLGVWRFIATKDQRAAKAEIKLMVDYAQRQALEIAIIEQSAKLAGYKQQIAAASQPTETVSQPEEPVPVE